MYNKLKFLTVMLLAAITSNFAQPDIKDYQGNWEGNLKDASSFNFKLTLEVIGSSDYKLTIANQTSTLSKKSSPDHTDNINIKIDERLSFDATFNEDKTAISGFIKSGILMYHTTLKKTGKNKYSGNWNLFMVDRLEPNTVYLSVENYEDESFATYPFFGDQRFTGTWCNGFNKDNDIVTFSDFKTGIKFRAKLLNNKIQLEFILANTVIASTNLSRSTSDWEFGMGNALQNKTIKKPLQLEDGWEITSLKTAKLNQTPLAQMIDKVLDESFDNTHSVLISKKGKLVFEKYFEGFNDQIPHDQRSASKSVGSAMIGIAIDDKILESTAQEMYNFIPKTYQNTKDTQKSKITLKDLLTMSSGIGVTEDQYQETNNWLKTVLEPSLVKEPGSYTDYKSADPFLLGICLDERLKTSMEHYMDQKLLAPLGITNYIIQTDHTAVTPYFGGGMYLTPRDMLKFGQVYLNKGKWKGQQILSEKWVTASFQKHTRLEDARDKNEYGYLWWHKTYKVGNKEIESIEARGNGGQYIFVIPQLEAVVAITSGNFRNGKTPQPEKILEEYILPALLR